MAVDLLCAIVGQNKMMMANIQFCFWREVLDDLRMVFSSY